MCYVIHDAVIYINHAKSKTHCDECGSCTQQTKQNMNPLSDLITIFNLDQDTTLKIKILSEHKKKEKKNLATTF